VHVSGRRDVFELVANDQGGIVVLVALLLPFLVGLIALSVDIGNWWVHKRHLQLQADAAALAGGGLFGECFSNPSGANAAIQAEATKYAGVSGSLHNGQVGNANQGSLTVLYQSKTYAVGGPGPDDTETLPPCETSSLMFDVKVTESGLPLLFDFPGLDFVPSINAHARVQLRAIEVQEGMLPVAVPDLRFNYVFASFVDETSGATLATVQLEKGGTQGGNQLWSTTTPTNVHIASGSIGVRLRLVGGTDPSATCGQLYTECYDLGSANGLVKIRGWSAGAAPRVQNAWLLSGTCAPDGYFAVADCSAGIQAEVDLGPDHPLTGTGVTTEVWAAVDGAGKYPLAPGGGTGLVTWSAATGLPIAAGGPHAISLHWSFRQTTGTWKGLSCNDKNNNPCVAGGSLGVVQRSFVASAERSGPIQRLQIFEPAVSTSGANSFEQGTTQSLGVSLAVEGSLKVQSEATDPVVELRVVGSQNQSIDCDPDIPNLRDEIAQGCAPAYKINPALGCPAYNVLWSLPQPWECVKTQTGGAVGQVEHGLKDRILGGANTCTAPINWPTYSVGDPRIVPLIITPFGSFGGTGNDIVPVIDFAAFYVVGWHGDPCPGAHPVPKGFIAGHFVKYATPNPLGAGENVCDPDSLTPCVAVLTR
jgi:hypothetical protein